MDVRRTREHAIEAVLEGLQTLIFQSAERLGQEQHAPSPNPEYSEELMSKCRRETVELRAMRDMFETLVTGVVGELAEGAPELVHGSQTPEQSGTLAVRRGQNGDVVIEQFAKMSREVARQFGEALVAATEPLPEVS